MINDFLTSNFNKNKDKPFIGSRKSSNEQFKWSTYQDIFTKAQLLASYLSKKVVIPPPEVFPFGTVCICSENREEWLISDFACGLNGLVSVGFHSSWPLDESITVASDIYASAAIVSSGQLDYFLKIAEKQKSLKLIICMDDIDRPGVIKLSDIYKIPIESYPILPNDYHTIIYSSGTTGSPKGLPITRQLWLHDAQKGPFHANERSVYLSFSNLAHGMDRGVAWQLISVGGQFAFSRGDHVSILDDCQAIEPSLIMSMPHFWNDLFYDYKQSIQKLIVDYLKSVEKVAQPSEQLVDLISTCCDQKSDNPIVTTILKEANSRIKRSIGSKCEVIGTGGSSISDQVLNFLKEMFPEANVIDSYGTTEVPGISTNGQISDNVELRLVDCPEIGYVSNETVKEGEIVVKMPYMSTAYWGKREETLRSTQQNFRDGWYFTQDIGRIDSSGRLSIIDRKSDLAELYVDGRSVWIPIQPIENLFLSNSKLFSKIYIHGDRAQSFLVAVIVPVNLQKVTKHQIYQEILKTARDNRLKPSETPRGIVVSDHEWTPESGEVTQTMKLRRSQLLKNFKAKIDEEYARLTALDEERDKLKSDAMFDYVDYVFACDDEENNDVLNSMFRPIKDSILKLREIAPEAAARVDAHEEKVAQESEAIKTACFNENQSAYEKAITNKDDTTVSNFLNTLSQNREKVKEACKRREDARYASDELLQKADGEVNDLIHHLIEKADELGEKLPFQISCGLLKLSPEKIRERNGNCLSESQAPSSWEVWCNACGDLIEVGKHGEGRIRYKCLDCDCVFCERCFEMLSKLNSSNLPFECFTKHHFLSREKMKFIRAEFKDMKVTDPLGEIFDRFCSKYENRIFIDANQNVPEIITYDQAKKQLNESKNCVIEAIRKDVAEGSAKEEVKKILKRRNDEWPLIVHVKKDCVDTAVVWNAMFNGGRIVID